jgi:hypothetical protein
MRSSHDESKVLESAWPKCGLNWNFVVRLKRPNQMRLTEPAMTAREKL